MTRPGKQALFLLFVLVGAALMVAWIPVLSGWRAGTTVGLLIAASRLSGARRGGRWSLLIDGAFVVGACYFDYLVRQASPVISPGMFTFAFLAVMLPLALVLQRRG